MPRVYIIDNDQPNAFATGRNPKNAAVATTSGLLRRLSQSEIAGFTAHELVHLKNRDTLNHDGDGDDRRIALNSRAFLPSSSAAIAPTRWAPLA